MAWTVQVLSAPQAVEGALPTSQRLLQIVNGDVYYVTSAQVGVAEATFQLNIYRSADHGHSWTKVVTNYDIADPFCSCAVGTTIYVFTINYPAPYTLQPYRFDAVTNAMLANGAAGPAAGIAAAPISATATSDGKIIVCYETAGGTTNAVVYDPGSNTWGTPVVTGIDAAATNVGQATDTDSDTTFVFYYTGGLGGDLRCKPISYSAGALTVRASVLVTALPDPGGLGGPVLTWAIGLCCITGSGTKQVAIPFIQPSDGYNHRTVSVARANVSATPTFSVETVEPGLVDGQIWAFTGRLWSGLASLDIAGSLYVFYDTDNVAPGVTYDDPATHDNSSSIGSLYARVSSGPGTWTDRQLVFATNQPGELATPYVVAYSADDAVVMMPWFNPVLFYGVGSKYDSLTGNTVTSGGGPPPTAQVGWILSY